MCIGLEYEDVAVRASDDVRFVDHVVKELGLDVLVLHHVSDVGLHVAHAQRSDGRDNYQQEQGDGKAQTEADADLKI